MTAKYLPLPMTVNVRFGGSCAEGPVTSDFSSAQRSLAPTAASKHLCSCYEAAPPCTERSVAKMKHENGDLFVSEALPVCDPQASWSSLRLWFFFCFYQFQWMWPLWLEARIRICELNCQQGPHYEQFPSTFCFLRRLLCTGRGVVNGKWVRKFWPQCLPLEDRIWFQFWVVFFKEGGTWWILAL